jgi:hypothetical protein
LKGKSIKVADGFIAATALHHDLTIVTRNVKDFEDLGVAILNPWELWLVDSSALLSTGFVPRRDDFLNRLLTRAAQRRRSAADGQLSASYW